MGVPLEVVTEAGSADDVEGSGTEVGNVAVGSVAFGRPIEAANVGTAAALTITAAAQNNAVLNMEPPMVW